MVASEYAETSACALCGAPATRRITARLEIDHDPIFCCYGCRYIYDIVSPDLAQGMDVRRAMGRAGLDLNASCCRGIVYGDPADVADRTLSRLMLNAFLAMMIMGLSLALYSDFFFAEWGALGHGVRSMLQTIIMVFATPAILLLAIPILEDAVLTFQVDRRLSTSALIAIGSLAAYGLSVYATFTGQGHTYFETATMTLLLVTLGRWLDAKTLVEGNRALDQLLARTPPEVSLMTSDHHDRRVPVEHVGVGDRIRLRPGEQIAVDGRVLSGASSVDESSMTGESKLASKGPGDTVYAGTINLDGSLVARVTEVGDDRVMGKLVRLLEEARLKRAPIEQLVDRVAGYFAPVVILLAMGTFVFWFWQDSLAIGFHTALAVLLIACPCALGIATPLAIWAALGRAAQKGILIHDSRTLEKLSHVHHIFFDKTGTLTTGQAALQAVICDDPTDPHMPARVLQRAASLEQGSEHPIASAILTAARARQLNLQTVDAFRTCPGLGLIGTLDGRPVAVGNARLMQEQGCVCSNALLQERHRLDQAGLTVVAIGWSGRVQGLLGFAETLRPSVTSALSELRCHGLALGVLTGDGSAAATALGHKLRIDIRSELLPHEKVQEIEKAEATGPVAMVGDGLNDAPALARASVGIALGCGADISREAADVSLIGNDLDQVAWTFALARRTYRTIGWNLVWAFAYNVIGVGLAVAGLLHPILAAAAMVLSSALVVGNSLRIRRF